MKIYISSTFIDLEAHRAAAAKVLRQLGHEILAMEDYVAADDRPLSTCLKHVEEADVYLGIFAWRYGYVPDEQNPGGKSITELEYIHARSKSKPCLIFLSEPSATWPPAYVDGVTNEGQSGRLIRDLRSHFLKKHLVSFFQTPDDLAKLASVAVRRLEIDNAIKSATLNIDSVPHLQSTTLITSHIYDILYPLAERAQSACAFGVNIGRWWVSRLFLLAALAADFTKCSQIVFLKKQDEFVAMCDPVTIKLRLGAAFPALEESYRAGLSVIKSTQHMREMDNTNQVLWDVVSVVMAFQDRIGDPMDAPWSERHLPSRERLEFYFSFNDLVCWLGDRLQVGSVESSEQYLAPWMLQKIMAIESPVVALVRDRHLLALVNRAELAVQIAKASLEQFINP